MSMGPNAQRLQIKIKKKLLLERNFTNIEQCPDHCKEKNGVYKPRSDENGKSVKALKNLDYLNETLEEPSRSSDDYTPNKPNNLNRAKPSDNDLTPLLLY